MKILYQYKSYLLYEVEEKDGIDITTSNDNKYVRNSILVFSSETENIKVGNEIFHVKDEEAAQKIIDENILKISMKEQLEYANKRSMEQEFVNREIKTEHKLNNSIEREAE